jgi:hypothetical protein
MDSTPVWYRPSHDKDRAVLGGVIAVAPCGQSSGCPADNPLFGAVFVAGYAIAVVLAVAY